MSKQKTPADKVMQILSFQYAPLEKQLKKANPELYAQYITWPSVKKIQFMDWVAASLNL